MSSAEKLADEFEEAGNDMEKLVKGGGGKRTKAEQHEHKHPHPEGDTRKIVNYCAGGHEKRKVTVGSTTKKE